MLGISRLRVTTASGFGFLACFIIICTMRANRFLLVNFQQNMSALPRAMVSHNLSCVGCEAEEDKYRLLLFGVELDDLQNRSYGNEGPFVYMKEYKNPCWLEQLTPDYLTEYSKAPYKMNGANEIERLSIIFEERLRSNVNPWRIRCLPYFYLLGVTKSGTTDLFEAICKHQSVHKPWIKEPMYWNRSRYPGILFIHKEIKLGHMTIHEYLNFFDYAAHMMNSTEEGHNHITGDGSSYMFWEDNGWQKHPGNKGLKEPRYTTAMALRAAQPKAKLILSLRNPTSRVYSDYNMHMMERKLIASVEDFHNKTVDAIQQYHSCFMKHGIRSCVYNESLYRYAFPMTLRASLYSVHLRDWLSVFPIEQIMIIKSEDYFADRRRVLNEIFTFLDIGNPSNDEWEEILREEAPHGMTYMPMLPETKYLLDIFFKPFNKELENMLDRHFWE